MTEFLFDTKYTVFICYNEVFWYYFLKRFGSKLCNLEKRWRPVHLCQICVDQSNTDPKLHVAWMAHNININEAKWNLGKVNLETLLVSSLLINASGGSGPCCRAHVCWLSAIALLAVCWPTPHTVSLGVSFHWLSVWQVPGGGLWHGCHGYHLPWRWLPSRLATFKAPTLHINWRWV